MIRFRFSLMRVSTGSAQPTLNSTWASKRATTGAVATLQPLTLARMRPSCLLWRTTLIKPGFWLFTLSTYSISLSFSSSLLLLSSTRMISLSRCAGVRSMAEWMERSSTESASLTKMNTMLTSGRLAGKERLRHPLGLRSGRGRSRAGGH